MVKIFSNKLYKISCILPWIQRSYSSAITPINMAFTSYGVNKTLPPVVIMHGLLGSQRNWRGVARVLEKNIDNKIYTVDARNHGDSPHTAEHGSQYLAADVLQLLKNEDFGKACVLGHSMGGRAMMYLTLSRPEVVDRAIIVDISPIAVPRDLSYMEDIFLGLRNVSIPPNLTLGEGRRLAETQIKDTIGNSYTVEFILMNLAKRKNGEFYWRPNLKSLGDNLRYFSTETMEHLPPFKGPVMFVCGNQSNFVDPDHWPDIQKLFPNSELHWLDAGHLVHFDEPAKFMELVTEFLKR